MIEPISGSLTGVKLGAPMAELLLLFYFLQRQI